MFFNVLNVCMLNPIFGCLQIKILIQVLCFQSHLFAFQNFQVIIYNLYHHLGIYVNEVHPLAVAEVKITCVKRSSICKNFKIVFYRGE